MPFLALALSMLLSTHMENRRSCLSCLGFFCSRFLNAQIQFLVGFFFFPLLILTDQVWGRMAVKGECLDAWIIKQVNHSSTATCVTGSCQNKHRCFSPWGIHTALFEAHAYDALRCALLLYAQQVQKPQHVLCTSMCLLQKFAKDILITGRVRIVLVSYQMLAKTIKRTDVASNKQKILCIWKV